ncbi:MAG: hypothetical protein A2928_03475 [Candidatus Taylorbacteria bacterium RIFCSPLOWO2_01_FULL_45_15b]|uniref:Ada DNA repair metal-binding domain-containing protein n=1 Tax=Candidatus Taylorbacteria bacterium RIFCSPLOWO2_01_FULL_45_15b TaxID=1802319 RepID=A0A1G2NEH4_9BACT|nr:MAG: hypothetical protein A2928_03475 [Candidatus Taylorbacteria bacterium RIFCSPLOWO2_01_FULL_45_15b]
MSIRELLRKSKVLAGHTINAIVKKDTFVGIIIILVGTASFGLGRLSKIEDTRPNIEISGPIEEITYDTKGGIDDYAKNTGEISQKENFAAVSANIKESASTGKSGEVVASKSGEKYHFPWCSGAKRIAVANKITFPSIESARAAGYTPAANCKGLK